MKYTRAIIDAIHSGELRQQETAELEIFGLHVPTKCSGVPDELLIPKNSWTDKAAYDETLKQLAQLFNKNFKNYEGKASKEIIGAGPKL